jgi:amino acid transporter
MSEKEKRSMHWLPVLGLALAFPSSILGVCFLAYKLYKLNIIPEWASLVLVLIVTANMLYLMIHYASKRKN